MYDTTQDADQLFDEAVSEAEALNHATSAALYGEASEAFLACGNHAMAALSLGNRAAQMYVTGDYVAAAAIYTQAAELAEQAEDVLIRVNCLWGRADSLAAIDDWSTVLTLCAEAIPLMRRYGYEDHLGDTLLLRARAHYWLDQEEDALASADEASAVYRSTGAINGQLRSADFAMTVLLYLGRHDSAQRTARRNVEISRSTSDRPDEAYHRRRLGEALLACGRPHEAKSEFEQSRDIYRDAGYPASSGVAAAWLGRALGSMGRAADAADVLRSASAVLDAAGPRWSWERDNARRHLAAGLHDAGLYDESAATDHLLLTAYLDESRPLNRIDARVVERLTSSLVHLGRAEEATSLLGHLARGGAISETERGPALAVRACAAWAGWHTGDRATSHREALDLVADPDLEPSTLAEAWVLEIIGTTAGPDDLEGIAKLARAVSVYLRHGEYARVDELVVVLMERTKRH